MEKQEFFEETNKKKHSEHKPVKEGDASPSLHNIAIRTLAPIKLLQHSFVLEVGFANTAHLPFLFQKVKGICYYGNNISDRLIQEAAAGCAQRIKEGHAQFIQAKQCGTLDFGSGFFDYCFTINTIYFWQNPVRYLEEIYRVLRPGGMFNLAFIEREFGADLPWTQVDFTFYNINEVKRLLRNAGFVNIDSMQMTEQIIGKDGKKTIRPFVSIAGKK